MQFFLLTAHEMHDQLIRKEISAEELNKAVFARIDAVEEQIGAYITRTEENALAQARAVDRQIRNGENHTLSGIPMAIKDNICTDGIKPRLVRKSCPISSRLTAPLLLKTGGRRRRDCGKANLDELRWVLPTKTQPFSPHGTHGIPAGCPAAPAGAPRPQ